MARLSVYQKPETVDQSDPSPPSGAMERENASENNTPPLGGGGGGGGGGGVAAAPVSTKSSKKTPAWLVQSPAKPGWVRAEAEASVAVRRTCPPTDAESETGPAPVAVSDTVANPLSAVTPLGPWPRTVTRPPRTRRSSSAPLPRSTTS